MSNSPFVVVEDRGAVRQLTLTQPERKNAVPGHGWGEISSALADFAASRQRVVILRGAGPDFCSGADLNLDDLDDLKSPAVGRQYMQGPAAAATALHRLPKPSIAAVDGVAVGLCAGAEFGFAEADQIYIHHLGALVPVGKYESGYRRIRNNGISESHCSELFVYFSVVGV